MNDNINKLTTREQEVLELILKGQNNKQIAASLQITYNTAKVHAQRILSKLGCNSKNEVMARILAPLE